MGSAKVRSGFSGGPIITEDGKVQGILSQRDDDNNCIFVRSDVILTLLKRYEKRSGRALLTRKPLQPEPAMAAATASETGSRTPTADVKIEDAKQPGRRSTSRRDTAKYKSAR